MENVTTINDLTNNVRRFTINNVRFFVIMCLSNSFSVWFFRGTGNCVMVGIAGVRGELIVSVLLQAFIRGSAFWT